MTETENTDRQKYSNTAYLEKYLVIFLELNW